MKEMTTEKKIATMNCATLAQTLAWQGHTCYTSMYEHRIELNVHCDSPLECQDALKYIRVFKPSIKEQQIEYRYHTLRGYEQRKWYIITLKF